jgi:hypothetical protein
MRISSSAAPRFKVQSQHTFSEIADRATNGASSGSTMTAVARSSPNRMCGTGRSGTRIGSTAISRRLVSTREDRFASPTAMRALPPPGAKRSPSARSDTGFSVAPKGSAFSLALDPLEGPERRYRLTTRADGRVLLAGVLDDLVRQTRLPVLCSASGTRLARKQPNRGCSSSRAGSGSINSQRRCDAHCASASSNWLLDRKGDQWTT